MKAGWVAVLILLLLIPALSASLQGDSARILTEAARPSRSDSAAAALEVCRAFVRDTLEVASQAVFSAFPMRRDRYTGSFIGRGEVSVPNALGMPVTHRFVCVVAPDGSRPEDDSDRSGDQDTFDRLLRQYSREGASRP